jgi:hypothetical protein
MRLPRHLNSKRTIYAQPRLCASLMQRPGSPHFEKNICTTSTGWSTPTKRSLTMLNLTDEERDRQGTGRSDNPVHGERRWSTIKNLDQISPINVETLPGHPGGLRGANPSYPPVFKSPIPLFTTTVRSVKIFLTRSASERLHDAWDRPCAGPDG